MYFRKRLLKIIIRRLVIPVFHTISWAWGNRCYEKIFHLAWFTVYDWHSWSVIWTKNLITTTCDSFFCSLKRTKQACFVDRKLTTKCEKRASKRAEKLASGRQNDAIFPSWIWINTGQDYVTKVVPSTLTSAPPDNARLNFWHEVCFAKNRIWIFEAWPTKIVHLSKCTII